MICWPPESLNMDTLNHLEEPLQIYTIFGT